MATKRKEKDVFAIVSSLSSAKKTSVCVNLKVAIVVLQVVFCIQSKKQSCLTCRSCVFSKKNTMQVNQ